MPSGFHRVETFRAFRKISIAKCTDRRLYTWDKSHIRRIESSCGEKWTKYSAMMPTCAFLKDGVGLQLDGIYVRFRYCFGNIDVIYGAILNN